METRFPVGATVVEAGQADMTDIAPRPPIVRTFMTHDMRDEDIEALSTGREDEFARIMSAVARSRRASPGALQHVVVYGSRGFGKSFMTRRVQIAVTGMEGDLGPVIYILLPEEQHNLQRSPHALLDTIALKLADVANNGDDAFEAAMFQWPKPGEEAKRWDQAAIRLEHAIDDALAGGKGLVIAVVENFDVLLATLFKNEEDEQRLRLWLDRRKNRVMLFATATGTVDLDYERPLFKALEPVQLSPWTAADCIAYFNRHREHEGRKPLDGEQEAKARAIADFIGGTPRLAQLLADVLDTQDALTVAETMSALADRLAEYYRRRIEDLPPLGRGLLDALIRGGEPASQTELATRVGADGQSEIARAMGDLQRADIVRGRPAPDGRETLYSVTDRVFVHYYRLRQGSRAVRATPLATILDFLKSFYSRDEQRAQGLRHLEAGRPAEAGLFSRLALEGEQRGENYYCTDFAYRLKRYLDAAPDALGMDAATVTELLENDPAQAHEHCRCKVGNTPAAEAILSVVRAQALYRLGHSANATAELRKAAALDDADAGIIGASELVMYLDVAAWARTPAAEVGLNVQTHLTEVRSFKVRIDGLLILAWSLSALKRCQEALAEAELAGTLAVQIGDTDAEARALRDQAFSLGQLGYYEEAINTANRAADRAAQIGNKNTEAGSLWLRAFSLGEMGQHEQAVEIAKKAADCAAQIGAKRQEASSLRLQAFSLNRLGRYNQAWESLGPSLSLRHIDDFEFTWAAKDAVLLAALLPHREIVSLCAAWIEAWRDKGPNDQKPDPSLWVSDMFVAAARAGAFAELDDLLGKEGDWLANEAPWFRFSDAGSVIARVAEAEGRARAYETAAGLLPRIKNFITKLPPEKHGREWISSIISGFAAACRDPGLLRDVAMLLTEDLAPDAPESGRLLRALAGVDEAGDAERILARMDPDMATLIRRLRNLPDPPPLKPKRAKARPRKPQ
jgi:tetratricopeptide (TPR) repeat protein